MTEVQEKFLQYCKDFEKGEVRYIAPMASQEYKDVDISDVPFDYKNEIAELKYDGHRGIMYLNGKGNNRVFSRVVSKKTGWFTENTDNVPHFRDMKIKGLEGTVLDGEFDYGTTSMGVQSVMGSLPERAIKYQEENGFIYFKAFDILFYKGIDIRRMPLYKRKVYLSSVIYDLLDMNDIETLESAQIIYADDDAYKKMGKYAEFNQMGQKFVSINSPIGLFPARKVKDFPSLMKEVLYEEMEGIMTKNLDGIYESKRSKAYIKFKGESTWDCVVMGLKPSTKEYKGKELMTWKYWEIDGKLEYVEEGFPEVEAWTTEQGIEAIPVTKPYFNGWCGAIEFGVAVGESFLIERDNQDEAERLLQSEMKDGKKYVFHHEDEAGFWFIEVMHVGDCKGLTEELQEDIKNNFHDLYLGQVIEVRANGIINKETGTLRHPVFERMRYDKTAEECTFEDHIRVELR